MVYSTDVDLNSARVDSPERRMHDDMNKREQELSTPYTPNNVAAYDNSQMKPIENYQTQMQGVKLNNLHL